MQTNVIIKKIALITSCISIIVSHVTGQNQGFYLVPTPQHSVLNPGIFMLENLKLAGAKPELSPFEMWLNKQPQVLTKPKKEQQIIEYEIDRSIQEEGYNLEIKPQSIKIKSAGNAGFMYAEQTLIQLATQNGSRFIPCLDIKDTPRFKWRGMHLDESRHFLGKEFAKKYIDWLFTLKMNVMHWHLTDAPGWRIEIKKYPKLTSVGAWRPDRSGILFGEADTAKVGEPMTYGGFYTQHDIREIVKYAQERNITIIPEIEMPGHTTAALVAYPEYSCTGGPFPMPGGAKNCPYPNFCVGNEATYTFLQNVLTEVIDLFPSPYIHIGGDEVEREQWTHCDKCQKLKKDLQLNDEAQLQIEFTKRIEKFIQSKGRKLMGWDEIMEGETLTPSSGVMVWRGEELVKKAAQAGHDVVITHNYYFDLYQGNPAFEPITYGYLPLEKVYKYNPVPSDFDEKQSQKVLGVQGCLWTENIEDPAKAEYMLFPRLLALAEVAWTEDHQKDWYRFKESMPSLMNWLKNNQTNFATSIFDPEIELLPDTVHKIMNCVISQQVPFGDILFTLDGSDPKTNGKPYHEPIKLSEKAQIKATVNLNNGTWSKSLTASYAPSMATGKKITVEHLSPNPYNGMKPYVLTDGMTGSQAFHDGKWFALYGDDISATIDLDSAITLNQLTMNWLEAERSWIYLPEEVYVTTSLDGERWVEQTHLSKSEIAGISKDPIKTILVNLNQSKARWVRIHARNKGQHPIYPEGKCWLFIDELKVD